MSGAAQTVGPVVFDYRWFETRYPEISEWCSPGQLQGYFDIATLYCDNTDTGAPTPAMCDLWFSLGMLGFPPIGGPIRNIKIRQMLLGMLTAHVAQLNGNINGNAPSGLVGRVTNASEGSISVGVSYPETADAAWFGQTRYGAMFWQATKQYRMAQYFPGPGASFGRFPFGRII
jgi:hypothetical protein